MQLQKNGASLHGSPTSGSTTYATHRRKYFQCSEPSDVPMTSQDVDQYGQDYFSEAFSGINRFRRNPMQQDETPPRITTSVPAQSATEVTYPSFTRHGDSPLGTRVNHQVAPIDDDDTYVEDLWNELTTRAIVPVEQPPQQTVLRQKSNPGPIVTNNHLVLIHHGTIVDSGETGLHLHVKDQRCQKGQRCQKEDYPKTKGKAFCPLKLYRL